jgi:two-component system sensor histidine kinase KdpD
MEADATGVVEAAGHFRIYLGAAAGVGKTYAMLCEGHRRQERGADVVIGFVECHGRRLTEELIEGLEVVPRKTVEYRGSRLEEMDLDAVVRRQPKIALIDELAHTNVPGSGPHEKRWQDVMDILGAGIDVITTVNIQHLESIADGVEHMTGVKVRERVPDWVVRKADQIELVDSSPEQLRRRMLHGNIYPKERVPQALTHFFRTNNLIALRELALRFSPTRARKTSVSISGSKRPRPCGRPPSASWPPSPRPRGPMCCCGGRLASRPGSRANSTSFTLPPATPSARAISGRLSGCDS